MVDNRIETQWVDTQNANGSLFARSGSRTVEFDQYEQKKERDSLPAFEPE